MTEVKENYDADRALPANETWPYGRFRLVLGLTEIRSSSVQGLMIMALLFGFGGSAFLHSVRWMALRSVGGEVIEQPRKTKGTLAGQYCSNPGSIRRDRFYATSGYLPYAGHQ